MKLPPLFEMASDLLVREWLRAGREDTLDEHRRRRILLRLTGDPSDDPGPGREGPAPS